MTAAGASSGKASRMRAIVERYEHAGHGSSSDAVKVATSVASLLET
jgi:hypothetical protein